MRPLTYRRYESIVRQHLIPGFGHHRLDKLTADQVQAFLNGKATTLSPRSVHHLRTVLRTALGKALKWGKVSRNVAALTDSPKLGESIGKFLTMEQAHAFLAAAQGE